MKYSDYKSQDLRPNYWDLVAFLLVMGLITVLAWGSRHE
jgi:hypothetical protein